MNQTTLNYNLEDKPDAWEQLLADTTGSLDDKDTKKPIFKFDDE